MRVVSRAALLPLVLGLCACAGSDRIPVTGATDGSSVTDGTGGSPGTGGGTGVGGDDGGSVGGSGATSATTGSPASTGAAGGGGEGGGSPPLEVCGDGVVAGVEECDDGNVIDDDGCTTCVVDCEPQGTKHPVTGHCYLVFPDATTWPFAEANCQAWGGSPGLGHLASIGGQGEQDLVYSLITVQTWIGVQDPVVEGDYEWSDGSVWDYEFWAPGEPDNTYEEDCAFMRVTDDGGWNDHACGDTRPAYVCERRAAGTF